MNKKKNGISLGFIILIIIIIIATVFLLKKINPKVKVNSSNNETLSSEKQTADANFKVKDIKCLAGQEIDVEVELLNDCEFVAANFEYKYDSTNLEYINYEVGDSIKNGAMTIVNNDKTNDKVLIGFVAKPDGEKIIKSGKIIDIKFKVKDRLTKNRIDNIFDSTTLKKEDGTDVSYNVQQGMIEIKEGGVK